jgi:hypothetical protein
VKEVSLEGTDWKAIAWVVGRTQQAGMVGEKWEQERGIVAKQ